MRSLYRRRVLVVAALIALGVFTIGSQYQSANASSLNVTFLCEDGGSFYDPFDFRLRVSGHGRDRLL